MKWIVLAVLISLSGCLSDFGDNTSPKDLITDQKSKWVIEIDYVQGHRPSQDAIDLLKSRLNSLVHKNSIQVLVDDVIPSAGADLDIDDFERLKDKHKDRSTSDDTAVTYVLYLDGNSDQDDDDGRVLGLAYSHDTVVMFDETINGAANLRFSSTDIERAVLVHEFGHILGLVNNGIPMVHDHEHPTAKKHSDNSASVMTPAVETTTNLYNLIGGLPTDFDADDRADVCAAGGRC